MDKLEHYLDQVCHGIAGPRDLRLHIRQELREHLLDAVAEHRHAGLSEEDALTRALDDFGGPAEVRSELEAAHGHRLMAVVLDKALQWKEKTMKAKWLWTTWAHVALGLVIVGEVVFVYMMMIFIAPKFRQLLADGTFDMIGPHPNSYESWTLPFLNAVTALCDIGWVIAIAVSVLWGLFEWRVHNDNKTSMRLTALGSIAVLLFVLVAVTATALGLPAYIELRPSRAAVEREVMRDSSRIDAALITLRQAATAGDWETARRQTSRIHSALFLTGFRGPDTAVLLSPERHAIVESNARAANADLQAALDAAQEMIDAVDDHDAQHFEAAYRKFDAAYRQGLKGDITIMIWPSAAPATTTQPSATSPR